MLEQPAGWIPSPELLQASKMTVFHMTVVGFSSSLSVNPIFLV
ncbi:hypothetical protein [Anaerostipes sp. 992a]|nr:hypothetical protein [Anaerostipes sp. 992a]